MSMISNEASVIDEGAFSVRRTIVIAAPLEKVWSAVTEPEHISQWFGQAAFDGVGRRRAGHPHVPRLRRRAAADRGARRAADGLVPVGQRRRERPRCPTRSTTSTRRSSPSRSKQVPDGTRLTVVETGFETTSDPAANLESHRTGWNDELDKLVALLESGS